MWAHPESDNQRRWIKGRPTSLQVHLRDCALQPQLVRNQASEEYNRTAAPNSPRRRRHNLSLIAQDNATAVDINLLPTTAPDSTTTFPIDPLLLAASQPPTPGPSTLSFDSNSQAALSALRSFRSTPALSTPSVRSRQSRGPARRVSSQAHLTTPSFNQTRFETLVTHLTASARFPLNWVENPVWLTMCDEFMPNAKSPLRKTLTQRLLPTAVNDLCTKAKDRVRGLHATIQADGWSGENMHRYIALMMTAGGEVCCIPCSVALQLLRLG